MHSTENIPTVLKEIIGRYVLRKPNIRQKMGILNSLTVPKNMGRQNNLRSQKGEPNTAKKVESRPSLEWFCS